MKWLSTSTVERVTRNALLQASGLKRPEFKSRSLRMVEWDISGTCRAPVLVQLFGRPLTERGGGVFPAQGKPMHMDLWTRCRKCDPCLHARRLLWQDKGRMEYAAAPRTWLLTLTNRPDVHARQLAVARHKLAKQGLDFDALPYGEQFILRAREMGIELTKFFKRLRKNSGAPFRYLAVTEMHKNGAPHQHVLIHETDMTRPLRKHMIQSCWNDGFSNCKLVESVNQAVYVCKYLSKTKVARVRASLRYGKERSDADQAPSGLMNEMKKEIRSPAKEGKQGTFPETGGLTSEEGNASGHHARLPVREQFGDSPRIHPPLADPTPAVSEASESREIDTYQQTQAVISKLAQARKAAVRSDLFARLHGRFPGASESDEGNHGSLSGVARAES